MANTLTGLALYAALSEQVYRRAYVKNQADQPLKIDGDGGTTTGAVDQIPGQTFQRPTKDLNLDTNKPTEGRFLLGNSHITASATTTAS